MQFNSLEDAERAYKDLGEGFNTLLATMKAYHVVLSSLVATHPDYNKFQLKLSALAEVPAETHFLRDSSESERATFQKVIESFQQIKESNLPIGWPFAKKKGP